MIGVDNKLMEAWYSLLNGNISVNVYRTNVLEEEKGNYVLIRNEGGSENPIQLLNWTKHIIIIEIVTVGVNSAEDEIAGNIDNEITQLLCPDYVAKLPEQPGIQIGNIYRDSVTTLDNSDKVSYLFRKIIRYRHDVTQR